MNKPNYSEYSIQELENILEFIDHDKWPERVAEIESVLNNPKQRFILEQEQAKTELEIEMETKVLSKGLIVIYLAISTVVVVMTGHVLGRYGIFEIESTWGRIAFGVFMAACTFYIVKSKFWTSWPKKFFRKRTQNY